MNFTVKPLEIFGALQEIIEFDLVPSNFNPLILIKCSISASIEKPNQTPKKKKKKIKNQMPISTNSKKKQRGASVVI